MTQFGARSTAAAVVARPDGTAGHPPYARDPEHAARLRDLSVSFV